MASTLQPLLDSQDGARRQSSDLLAVRVHHIVDDGPHDEPSPRNCEDLDKYHQHYSDRAPWLRAAVLGANDGLVSVASIMLGVSGGTCLMPKCNGSTCLAIACVNTASLLPLQVAKTSTLSSCPVCLL